VVSLLMMSIPEQKFWQVACNMVLIYLPDGTNVYGLRGEDFEA